MLNRCEGAEKNQNSHLFCDFSRLSHDRIRIWMQWKKKAKKTTTTNECTKTIKYCEGKIVWLQLELVETRKHRCRWTNSFIVFCCRQAIITTTTIIIAVIYRIPFNILFHIDLPVEWQFLCLLRSSCSMGEERKKGRKSIFCCCCNLFNLIYLCLLPLPATAAIFCGWTDFDAIFFFFYPCAGCVCSIPVH